MLNRLKANENLLNMLKEWQMTDLHLCQPKICHGINITHNPNCHPYNRAMPSPRLPVSNTIHHHSRRHNHRYKYCKIIPVGEICSPGKHIKFIRATNNTTDATPSLQLIKSPQGQTYKLINRSVHLQQLITEASTRNHMVW